MQIEENQQLRFLDILVYKNVKLYHHPAQIKTVIKNADHMQTNKQKPIAEAYLRTWKKSQIK